MENNMQYSLAEHRSKMLSNLQDFLNYKRANSLDFGTRLLDDFKVVNFRGEPKSDSYFVEFEGYENLPHKNHYWVLKSEFETFMRGNNLLGVNLLIDNSYLEKDAIIFEVNLLKNGFKKPTIHDANKMKGIQIKRDGKIYKSYDVQVVLLENIYIEKSIRIFVFELLSADSYINKHTVWQNKVEIKNGITFEDFNNQEYFVRKLDALEAVRLERKSVISELKAWYALNMADKLNENISNAFLKKLSEINN